MDDTEFNRLLKICRIKLNEKEYNSIKKDVNEILDYFKILNELDTSKVSEAFHPIKIPEKLEEDNINDFDNVEGILKNSKTYRFYVVGPDL
ncbi:MAG: Asp-tRNA(Asn)/Glu-tRNA(Gln) amidotransferase subunit GatC [Candidatus Micrarchaeaceae archaeon]